MNIKININGTHSLTHSSPVALALQSAPTAVFFLSVEDGMAAVEEELVDVSVVE